MICQFLSPSQGVLQVTKRHQAVTVVHRIAGQQETKRCTSLLNPAGQAQEL